ncbi:tetratricopeptide repeat protein [bacterium]|nr:tetratricopeptide repeat protein [bacterium]
MRRFLLIMSTLLWMTVGAAQTQNEFQAGLAAFQSGDWKSALQQWEQLTLGGESSGALEYNIGNAYFRLGETASAILHYERALRFLPTDEDVIHNLRLANLGTVDRIDPTLRLGIWEVADGARDAHSARQIAVSVIWFSLIAAASVALWLVGPSRLRKSLKRASVATGILLVLLCLWYVWRSSYEAQTRAIVMAEKTDIYSGPSDSSTQLFSLHSGSKVRVYETLSGWLRVGLPDGRDGWMKDSDAEHI